MCAIHTGHGTHTIASRCGPTDRHAAPRVIKRGAVKYKLSSAFISRRGAARRSAAFGGAVAFKGPQFNLINW